MICWQAPLRHALLATAIVAAGIAVQPEPAAALPGAGVNVGAAAHIANTGFAYDVNGTVSVMGFGVNAMYWAQPALSNTWTSAVLQKNLSFIPMTDITPGVGVAVLNGGVGPMGQLSAAVHPLLMPFAIEGSVGAAYLNGSMALPYAVGAKLSLIPFTSFVARWRGWEGATAIKNSGPEIGVEIGI